MFVGSCIAVGGLKILTSRLLDNRKIIAPGLAVVAGLGHDRLLTRIDSPPELVDAALSTSLSATELVAIILNALLRLGSKKHLKHSLKLDAIWPDELNQLSEGAGATR